MVRISPTKDILLFLTAAPFLIGWKCQAFSYPALQSKARTSATRSPLFASSSKSADSSETKEKKKNTPFFANAIGGGVGSFFASAPASTKANEGKAASITTRLALGTLFDSREYTFETLTNVR